MRPSRQLAGVDRARRIGVRKVERGDDPVVVVDPFLQFGARRRVPLYRLPLLRRLPLLAAFASAGTGRDSIDELKEKSLARGICGSLNDRTALITSSVQSQKAIGRSSERSMARL